MKTLNLILKKQWYDMIESGVKKQEYRENKEYWISRLFDWRIEEFNIIYTLKKFDIVKFRHGYQKDARTMQYKIENITIGRGNPEWGAPTDRDVFIIDLGERING